jgi:hypothetical protein
MANKKCFVSPHSVEAKKRSALYISQMCDPLRLIKMVIFFSISLLTVLVWSPLWCNVHFSLDKNIHSSRTKMLYVIIEWPILVHSSSSF